MTKTIFVQIASYRDTELVHTISSCLENAHDASRLRFGICWQYDAETAFDLAQYENDARFRIEKISYDKSKGCCWARNRTNRLYQDEDFTLQIDAHMRFAPGWDRELIGMLCDIDHHKPLITTYPPGYHLNDGKTVLSSREVIQRLRLKKMALDLTTILETEPVTDLGKPEKSRFLAAGYFFTLGRFCREVEYDPKLYFAGEEITLAARAFTHGYNFYYPNQNLIWHLYNHHSPLHWSDSPDQGDQKNQAALKRIDTLFLGDHTQLGKYGLGDERSLPEFEAYADVSFAEVAKRRELGDNQIPFRQKLLLNTDGIERRDDYHVWIFALLNDDDVELYRYDITDADVLGHRKNAIAIDETLPDIPTKYLLWPKHQDWGPRLVFPLNGQTRTRGSVTEAKQPEIFVALAAYREAELALTIENCLQRALHPERLRFGVCLQYDDEGPPEMQQDCLRAYESDSRFRIVKYPYRHSKGGCWARNIVQSLYRSEPYTLQVDSHTRFLAGFDVSLITMMQQLPSPKPLITGFPPLYSRNDDQDVLIDDNDLSRVPTTVIESWADEGWIHHPTKVIPENNTFPRRTRVISGAFVFTLGKWNVEVNQDPDHLYTGEEFALTLRSFTWGYDLFNPSDIVVWHRNHPQPSRKYINDFATEEVSERHERAIDRLNTLLRGDPDGELGPFGLGKYRTLEQYRLFSGLDCQNKTIHPHAVQGVPPDPLTIFPADGPMDVDAQTTLSETLAVTVHVAGMQPVQMICEQNSPALKDLRKALKQNARRQPDSQDRLMYLNFGAQGREVYFLQSNLLYMETESAC